MHDALRVLSLLALAPLSALSAQSTRPATQSRPASRPGLSGIDTRAVVARVQQAMQRQELVGLALGVLRDRKIVHLQGFGYADREAKKKVDQDTRFRWASISKTVTAMRALQLVEEGKLDLECDVREYVPEFPDKGAKITTRQLLGHLGGIVHYRNGRVIRTRREYEDEHPFKDLVLALDTFKESPLVAEPGTKYAYSTHGFILAGAVLARAGDAGFAKQVELHIARPLGMRSFRPDYQWQDIPDRAVGYRKRGKRVVRSGDTDVSWKLPGGGYVSNVRDLARLGQCWLRKELLQPSSYRELWTAQKTKGGERTRYGLGFSLGEVDGVLQLGHSGAQQKTRTYLWVAPEGGHGVAVMCNSEYAKLRPLVRDLMKLVAPKD